MSEITNNGGFGTPSHRSLSASIVLYKTPRSQIEAVLNSVFESKCVEILYIIDNSPDDRWRILEKENADGKTKIRYIHNENLGYNDSLQVQHGDIRNSNSILLYICTKFPVKDSDKSVWLGGEEIRRDVILHYQSLAEKCGIDMQLVMDFDAEFVSEEKLGYEKVESE